MKKVIKENGLHSADRVAGRMPTLRNRHIHHRHDMWPQKRGENLWPDKGHDGEEAGRRDKVIAQRPETHFPPLFVRPHMHAC